MIYILLQRTKTAREAIALMDSLTSQYGYASEGETFSIGDPSEVWICDMIGRVSANHCDSIPRRFRKEKESMDSMRCAEEEEVTRKNKMSVRNKTKKMRNGLRRSSVPSPLCLHRFLARGSLLWMLKRSHSSWDRGTDRDDIRTRFHCLACFLSPFIHSLDFFVVCLPSSSPFCMVRETMILAWSTFVCECLMDTFLVMQIKLERVSSITMTQRTRYIQRTLYDLVLFSSLLYLAFCFFFTTTQYNFLLFSSCISFCISVWMESPKRVLHRPARRLFLLWRIQSSLRRWGAYLRIACLELV